MASKIGHGFCGETFRGIRVAPGQSNGRAAGRINQPDFGARQRDVQVYACAV